MIQDVTSKWLEVFEVKHLSASRTNEVFREVFSRFGLPRELCTDNGRTFTSEEFQTFLVQGGIKHSTGAPYHPPTNGQAESAVKILKNAILKSKYENPKLELNLILQRFLFHFRNTPHTTTGESPAKMLFGRGLRTKFDLLMPSTVEIIKSNQERQQNFSSRVKDIIFEINDKVWIKYFRLHSSSPWCPGIITEMLVRIN